jgi:glycosyltransferase involved in cell wall biosynthesis
VAKDNAQALPKGTERANESPLVSIGLPVYNGEDYLHLALDLLLTQDYENFELIISDNASTDRTPEICQEYVAKDSRIRYIRQPENRGSTANFNVLLTEARGDYFMWAATDDLWDKSFIKTLLHALVSHPQCVLAFCHYSFINEAAEPIERMGSKSIDYGSRTRLGRLIKLCWYYDDGCFYGLFKREAIKDLRVPTWTWKGTNRRNPLNNAYPVLYYTLAAGDFAYVDAPLWLNRIGQAQFKPFHQKVFVGYLVFLLRKLNVMYESYKAIYFGSSSLWLALATTPFLFMRFVFDAAGYWRHFRLQRAVRKVITSIRGYARSR